MHAKFSFPLISIEKLNGPKGLCDVVKASQVFFFIIIIIIFVILGKSKLQARP